MIFQSRIALKNSEGISLVLDFLFVIPVCFILCVSLVWLSHIPAVDQVYGRFLAFNVTICSFLVVGLRGQYGTDYENYYPVFSGEKISNGMGYLIGSIIEVGKFTFGLGGESAKFVFFIVWVLYIVFLIAISRRYGRYSSCVFIYLMNLLLFSNMLGSLRQGIAVCILSLAVLILIDGRKLLSGFFAALGVGTHLGAISLFPVFLITHLNLRYLLIGSLVLLIIGGVLYGQLDVMLVKLAFYAQAEGYGGGSSIIGKIVFFPFVMMALGRANALEKLIIIFFYTVAIGLPFIFSGFPIIAERLGIYFEVYKLVLLAVFIKRAYSLWVVKSFLTMLCLSTLYKQYLHYMSWKSYFPFGII